MPADHLWACCLACVLPYHFISPTCSSLRLFCLPVFLPNLLPASSPPALFLPRPPASNPASLIQPTTVILAVTLCRALHLLPGTHSHPPCVWLPLATWAVPVLPCLSGSYAGSPAGSAHNPCQLHVHGTPQPPRDNACFFSLPPLSFFFFFFSSSFSAFPFLL